MKNRYILPAIIAVGLTAPAIAQEKKPATLTEEIEVVRPYKPVLADAAKIRRSPDLNNAKPFRPVLTYSILDKRLEQNTDIRQLQAQQLADPEQQPLTHNLARIGVGTLNTGIGEVYINTGRDEALQAGFFGKHNSQKGELPNQRVSNQQFGVFGRSILDQITLGGRLMYDRRSNFLYGFDPNNPTGTPTDVKQNFNLIELDGEVLNQLADTGSPLQYAIKANGYLFSDAYEARENSFGLNGYFSKTWNRFSVGLNAGADFTGSKDLNYSLGNHILRANPFVRFSGAGVELTLGFNIVKEMGDNSDLNILPAASVELPIVPQYAILFGGINGDVRKTSLRELSYQNPFINSNLNLRNSLEKQHLYAGVKGNAGGGFGFRAMLFHKTIENLPLFVNNPTNINRFDLIYDNGESKQIGLEGELNIRVSDIFSIGGKAQVSNYKLATEKEAWFKPAFSLSANSRAQVNQKLFLDAEVLMQGESYGKIYTLAGEDKTKLKNFVDLSAGAEYRINNKLGVYVRANNLFGSNYQQYLYYPKFGMNIFGGLNYAF